jgi:hypothetical protein
MGSDLVADGRIHGIKSLPKIFYTFSNNSTMQKSRCGVTHNLTIFGCWRVSKTN